MSFDGGKSDYLVEIQVSMAKAAAKLPNPSLTKFHYEILEEIGRPPGLDVVDYFAGIADIPDDEVIEYFKFIGKPQEDPPEETEKDPQLQLAEDIASAEKPTVLKFRQAFSQKFGNPPSEELTVYFLEKIQNAAKEGKAKKEKTSKKENQPEFALAKSIAESPNATILKFREAFTSQFNAPPSEAVIDYFLKNLQTKSPTKPKNDEHESQVLFAKTVANGLVTTVLEFRKAFEKAYSKAPSPEIIDVYLNHRPRRDEDSEAL